MEDLVHAHGGAEGGEGGFAFARETLTAIGPTTFTATITNSGWSLGGGVVARLGNGGLYLKAEYNYVNFGTENVVLTDGVLEGNAGVATRTGPRTAATTSLLRGTPPDRRHRAA